MKHTILSLENITRATLGTPRKHSLPTLRRLTGVLKGASGWLDRTSSTRRSRTSETWTTCPPSRSWSGWASSRVWPRSQGVGAHLGKKIDMVFKYYWDDPCNTHCNHFNCRYLNQNFTGLLGHQYMYIASFWENSFLCNKFVRLQIHGYRWPSKTNRHWPRTNNDDSSVILNWTSPCMQYML